MPALTSPSTIVGIAATLAPTNDFVLGLSGLYRCCIESITPTGGTDRYGRAITKTNFKVPACCHVAITSFPTKKEPLAYLN